SKLVGRPSFEWTSRQRIASKPSPSSIIRMRSTPSPLPTKKQRGGLPIISTKLRFVTGNYACLSQVQKWFRSRISVTIPYWTNSDGYSGHYQTDCRTRAAARRSDPSDRRDGNSVQSRSRRTVYP